MQFTNNKYIIFFTVNSREPTDSHGTLSLAVARLFPSVGILWCTGQMSAVPTRMLVDISTYLNR